jgi:hypothetical protein
MWLSPWDNDISEANNRAPWGAFDWRLVGFGPTGDPALIPAATDLLCPPLAKSGIAGVQPSACCSHFWCPFRIARAAAAGYALFWWGLRAIGLEMPLISVVWASSRCLASCRRF